MNSNKPIIYIPKNIWNELVEEARKVKSQSSPKIKAFFLYSESPTPPIRVEDKEEMKLTIKKEEKTNSGLIFRWKYDKKDKEKYYPTKGRLRYTGTCLIQENLEMTTHFAFWMSVDFKRRGEPLWIEGYNINLWIADNDKPICKAYYVFAIAADRLGQTHGEFVEAEVIIK